MIHRLPIVILVVAVIATIVMLAERTVDRNAAQLSHRPAVAIATPAAAAVQGAETTKAAKAAPVVVSRRSEPQDESIPLYKRRAYRPNRSKDVVVAEIAQTDWVRVPGTGIALWPKPTG